MLGRWLCHIDTSYSFIWLAQILHLRPAFYFRLFGHKNLGLRIRSLWFHWSHTVTTRNENCNDKNSFFALFASLKIRIVLYLFAVCAYTSLRIGLKWDSYLLKWRFWPESADAQAGPDVCSSCGVKMSVFLASIPKLAHLASEASFSVALSQ